MAASDAVPANSAHANEPSRSDLSNDTVTIKKSGDGPMTRKRRKPPTQPFSILDRQALRDALDRADVIVKPAHIDAFYQALHRQHYPELCQFVETYYENERMASKALANLSSDVSITSQMSQRPLWNNVTNKKNKNLKQLPKAFLKFLATTTEFTNLTSRVIENKLSKDNSTSKLLIQLHDGQVVESVIMRYTRKGAGRASLCVSSQCGCAMGCTFCATGTLGLSGNLSTAEILEQLIHADTILAEESILRQQEDIENLGPEQDMKKTETSPNLKPKRLDLIRNIVFMGQGEPLDNYSNVVGACRAMMDRTRWNLANGHITVSTVGLVSQIRKLTDELPQVSLALSLHAPNQDMRTTIVPTATRYPIESLIDALDNHMMAYLKRNQIVGSENTPYTKEERIKESTRRRAMIEYVMLEGETSSVEAAHQLGKLCENRHLIVNLIPYNATDVKDHLQCPSSERMMQFRDIVTSYGAFCTIRRTMGADIAGACGQLVVSKVKEQQNVSQEKETKMGDIEDVVEGFGSPKRTVEKRKPTVVTKSQTRGPFVNVKQDIENVQPEGSFSWLADVSDDDLDRWGRMLGVASVLSASAFIVSSLLYNPRR